MQSRLLAAAADSDSQNFMHQMINSAAERSHPTQKCSSSSGARPCNKSITPPTARVTPKAAAAAAEAAPAAAAAATNDADAARESCEMLLLLPMFKIFVLFSPHRILFRVE